MVAKQTWIIDGENTMHCGGCAQTVQFSLSRLSAVVGVQADHRTQRIQIEVESPTIDLDDHILSELKSLGYTARKVNDEPLNDD